jgi:hypothetical protein
MRKDSQIMLFVIAKLVGWQTVLSYENLKSLTVKFKCEYCSSSYFGVLMHNV